MEFGHPFRYNLIEMYENEEYCLIPTTGYIKGLNIVVYDLPNLSKSINEAFGKMEIRDEKVLRFLEYFDRAVFMKEFYDKEDTILNKRFLNFICTEVFLNFYKALSLILGDPSVDRDYQSRYRKYGFDQKFFTDKMEYFRELRNKNDVSHYTMADDQEIYDEVKKKLKEIKEVAKDVFLRYLETLRT